METNGVLELPMMGVFFIASIGAFVAGILIAYILINIAIAIHKKVSPSKSEGVTK